MRSPAHSQLTHSQLIDAPCGKLEVDALEQFLQSEDIDAQLAILKSLAKDLLDKMPYTKSVTHVGTTAEQAFAMAAGVCQDHTHVFLALLRDKGIAARYVSGYI